MISAQNISDQQHAARFLEAIDPTADGWTFQTLDDSSNKSPDLTGIRYGTFEQHAKWLAAQNAKGAGVFVTINQTAGRQRTAESVTRVRALFADFDTPTPGILELLRQDPLPPSIIVSSSAGKWHVYWLVDEVELAEFKVLQQAIAARWGSDPKVCDLPRIMRLPGFQHCKGKPQPVQIIDVMGHRYGRELVEHYIPASAAMTEPIDRTQTSLSEELTAYALAALESACRAVADSAEGNRNNTLNAEAYGIGQLVAGLALPDALARTKLLKAGELAGLSRFEARTTIQSAFLAGAKQPRTAPTVNAVQLLEDLPDDTGAPLPLLPEIAEPTPYPVDSLPPLMRNAALAIAEYVLTPHALAGQCVLGAAAHLAQTRANAWDPSGSPDGTPCSLFLLTLAASGDGKSSARKLAFQVIDRAEKKARTQHHTDCEEIRAEAAQRRGKAKVDYEETNPMPPDPRTQYGDATFEPIAGDFIRGKSAASWDTDEGGQMLGGSSLTSETVRATLGGLTKAFDSGTFERTRSRGNLEGSGVAYNRRLSVHLLAQPATVAKALADPLLREQGFLPRFLFASPVSLAGTRFISTEYLGRKAHDDPRLQLYWAHCEKIMSSREHIDPVTREVTPAVVAPDIDALSVWVDFRNEIEAQSGTLGAFANLRAFANRGAQQALRIATVLACFEGTEKIGRECMVRACKLVRYSLAEWLRYTDPAAVDPVRQQAVEFMAWIHAPERAANWLEFHRDKVSKSGPIQTRPAKKRDAVLALLVKYRHLLTSDQRHYRINPIPPASAVSPQLSASTPHAKSIATSDHPQKPPNPQPKYTDADIDELIG